MTKDIVEIFTDGACKGNPGVGGWGALLRTNGKEREMCGGEAHTTNNRMELLAVITGLEAITKKELPVIVYSDSQYVVRAIEEGWLKNWIKTNFKGGKKNPDLWREFYELSHKHHIKFKWVKGHADNPYNNRCDELATEAADGLKGGLLVDEGFMASQ